MLRPHAEDQYAHELAALAALDDRERPPGWKLSPWAVVRYLLGGELSDGTIVAPKYVGRQRLVEIAVATLATDRALLLLGVPGTAKTWVSEHLAAAISGDSTLLVQGTAGTTEETLRYGWNYARLLAEGPSTAALVPGPVYRGMERGAIVRVEELTRMPAEVQDALVTVLSEKVLPVPELDTEIAAIRGFNVIATANDRDRGVNDLSSALRRRFNTVVLPLPATVDEEIDIVRRRVDELGVALALPEVPAAADEIRRVVTVFRELRSGPHRGRTDEPEGADRHPVDRRGDLGGHQRHRARRSLRRRPAPPDRRRRRHRRRRRQRSGPRQRRLAGVSRGRCSRPRRLGRLLRGVPRPRLLNRDDRDPMTVHLLGIRHHGPGSARSVLTMLDEVQPDVVLVELPADVEPVLRWIGDAGLRPPVAVLGYVVAEPARAAFAPLASFSPEWQAIAWANANDVPVPRHRPPARRDARPTIRGGGRPGERARAARSDRRPRRRRR